MRFLLKPSHVQSIRNAVPIKDGKQSQGKKALPVVGSGVSSRGGNRSDKLTRAEQQQQQQQQQQEDDANKKRMISWGQQCSPTCGCVVRFETNVDPVTQQIINSTYHAKTLITTKTTTMKDDNGGATSTTSMLKPVLTTRQQKPMFKDCDCETVHTLSRNIVNYLKPTSSSKSLSSSKRLDQIQGMVEYTSHRSSIAFRHTILKDYGLPTETYNNLACYDVVEDAFVSMIHGMMPQRRKVQYQQNFHKILTNQMASSSSSSSTASSDGTSSSLWTIRDPESSSTMIGSDGTDHHSLSLASLSSPHAMSTLTMFDINAEEQHHHHHHHSGDMDNYFHYSSDYYRHHQQLSQYDNGNNNDDHDGPMYPTRTSPRDWLSYIDEQNENDNETQSA